MRRRPWLHFPLTEQQKASISFIFRTFSSGILFSPLIDYERSERQKKDTQMMAALALIITCAQLSQAVELPGMAPTFYKEGQVVPLQITTLTPGNTWDYLVSFDYYTEHMNFCRPKGSLQRQRESLGSILRGEKVYNSPFELIMGKNESCKHLCTSDISSKQKSFATFLMQDRYYAKWMVDSVPVNTKGEEAETNTYYPGVSIGMLQGNQTQLWAREGSPMLNTHFDFRLFYHESPRGRNQVILATVQPSSRKNTASDNVPGTCDSSEMVDLSKEEVKTATYTYSVEWIRSETRQAIQMQSISLVKGNSLRLFLILIFGSLILVVAATHIVALAYKVHKDIAWYNAIDLSSEVQAFTGWKLLHGDVFRSPSRRMLLSVLLGNGIQLLLTAVLVLAFSALGLITCFERKHWSSVAMTAYLLLGFVGGYVSSRLYKTFGGERVQKTAIMTATLVPGSAVTVLIVMNTFLALSQSTGVVSFGSIVSLIALWVLVSIPISVMASLFGFKIPELTYPERTFQVHRLIPTQPRYLNIYITTASAGFLPFAAILVGGFHVLEQSAMDRNYNASTFLLFGGAFVVLTSGTMSIQITYLLLNSENHLWQWQSFLAGGAASFYLTIYALLYLFARTSLVHLSSVVLYLGYTCFVGFLSFVLLGSAGFLASALFTRKIYSSIKIE